MSDRLGGERMPETEIATKRDKLKTEKQEAPIGNRLRLFFGCTLESTLEVVSAVHRVCAVGV